MYAAFKRVIREAPTDTAHGTLPFPGAVSLCAFLSAVLEAACTLSTSFLCLLQGRLHMRQENVFLVQTKVRFSVTAVLLAQARARTQMAKVDLLLVPTALHHYTVQEIEAEEKNNDTARFSLESCTNRAQLGLAAIWCWSDQKF